MDQKEPQLTHLFTLRGHFTSDILHAGESFPSGHSLHIASFQGGFLRGEPNTRAEGLEATILSGGDWLRLDDTVRTALIDVRIQGRLSDGHGIYINYTGYLDFDPSGESFLRGAPDATSTSYGDHVWWTRPIMETSSPQIKWVEHTMFIGQGRWFRDGDVRAVEYRIFEVHNPLPFKTARLGHNL